jgi:hypothetical protein
MLGGGARTHAHNYTVNIPNPLTRVVLNCPEIFILSV